ncbi:ubiquinol oxidase subunit II [Jeongeupia wiesaeckerbachi]|uniref:ubiquinol oxidase subunit II n=1 Tax=Jeongeupia wiesaeckerbachi TaxID=3051218 RepID=UPI003D80291D
MKQSPPSRRLWGLIPCGLLLLLSGCKGGVFDPKGQVAVDERNLIILATALMLLVVIPVIVLTLVFAWKYRAGNAKATTYLPKWAHSTKIELIVWLVPCAIVAALAYVVWTSTHRLDPYRPLDSKVAPVRIEAVSMDWKWLFIYPDLGIATVNQIAFPVGTPINFSITSDSVLNSLLIPQLGGQIYAMPGMRTKLHLIADHAGEYQGLSAAYSGGGFSNMQFKALAMATPAEFQQWVAKVRQSKEAPLDEARYRALAKPSENSPVTYFPSVPTDVFHYALHQYMNMPKTQPAEAHAAMHEHQGKE